MKEGCLNHSFNVTSQNYWNNVEHMMRGGSSEESIKRCLDLFVQTFPTQTGSSLGIQVNIQHMIGFIYSVFRQTEVKLTKQALITNIYLKTAQSAN